MVVTVKVLYVTVAGSCERQTISGVESCEDIAVVDQEF